MNYNNYNDYQNNTINYNQSYFSNQQIIPSVNIQNIKSDKEIIESILKFRLLSKNILGYEDKQTMIHLFYKSSIFMLKEILKNKNNYDFLTETDINKLLYVTKKEHVKYKNLKKISPYTLAEQEEKFREIYVLIRFLGESQNLGREYEFIEALKSIEPVENFGYYFKYHLNKLKTQQLLKITMAKKDTITKEDIINIRQKFYDNKREKIKKIKEDEEICKKILYERKLIENSKVYSKKEQTEIYYNKCRELIEKIYENPINAILLDYEKHKILTALEINYFIYKEGSVLLHKKFFKKNKFRKYDEIRAKKIENNFMRIYVLLTFIEKSNKVGRNSVIIDTINSLYDERICTNRFHINISSLPKEEQYILNLAMQPFKFLKLTRKNNKN